MTECTGTRYWRKRIDECVARHLERSRQQRVNYMDMSDANLRRLVAWQDAYTKYLTGLRARWGRREA